MGPLLGKQNIQAKEAYFSAILHLINASYFWQFDTQVSDTNKITFRPNSVNKTYKGNVETNGGSLRTDLAFPTNTVDTRGCSLRGRHLKEMWEAGGGGGEGKKRGVGDPLLPFSSFPLLSRLQVKRVSWARLREEVFVVIILTKFERIAPVSSNIDGTVAWKLTFQEKQSSLNCKIKRLRKKTYFRPSLLSTLGWRQAMTENTSTSAFAGYNIREL